MLWALLHVLSYLPWIRVYVGCWALLPVFLSVFCCCRELCCFCCGDLCGWGSGEGSRPVVWTVLHGLSSTVCLWKNLLTCVRIYRVGEKVGDKKIDRKTNMKKIKENIYEIDLSNLWYDGIELYTDKNCPQLTNYKLVMVILASDYISALPVTKRYSNLAKEINDIINDPANDEYDKLFDAIVSKLKRKLIIIVRYVDEHSLCIYTKLRKTLY